MIPETTQTITASHANAMTAPVVTVTVIDDDADIRNGLWWLLNNVVGLRCEHTFAGCKEFLAHNSPAPDVLLLDVAMPEMSGLDGIRRIKARHPQLKIIMHSNFDDEDKIMRAQREGACGYVLKNASAPQLCDAILAAHRGGQVWPYGFAENAVRPRPSTWQALLYRIRRALN